MFRKNYRQITPHHLSQILSIRINVADSPCLTASLFIVNLRYIHLESLVFSTIEADPLHRLLQNLAELPRLFSLKIDTRSSLDLKQINYAYQLVFALPKLNSFGFDTDTQDDLVIRLLSLSIPQQMSCIIRLFMGQPCRLFLKTLTHLLIERCETKFKALRLHLERMRLPELRFLQCNSF